MHRREEGVWGLVVEMLSGRWWDSGEWGCAEPRMLASLHCVIISQTGAVNLHSGEIFLRIEILEFKHRVYMSPTAKRHR